MFCVRVLEERTMSEKLFLLIKYFDILFEISQTFTTAPNVMVISPLSLTTTSCLSHLWRLLSFWPRLTLGLAAKRRLVTLCHVSAVTCHASRPRLKRSFVAGPRRKRSWTAWWARQCTTPGYGRRESTEQVSSVHYTARSRLQQSQTFNKIWDIWAGADRRVISCQVLYEFQLLKASTSAL